MLTSNAAARATCAALLLAGMSFAPRALGQSCCAGSGAVTPGRLAMYEDALAGVQLKADSVTGSFSPTGQYTPAPSPTSELDFEQDIFGALRIDRHMQVALLVPFVETRQSSNVTVFGGGVGDINASARYDFPLVSRYAPDVAILAGLTVPTGTPPEKSETPTGIGAFQGNIGVALEKLFGPWLVDASAYVAVRTARDVQGVDEALAPQWTALVGGAYAFKNNAALGFLASYTGDGNATIDGSVEPNSGHHVVLLSASGVWPLSIDWRLQGSVFVNPPIVGQGQTATMGMTFTFIRAWIW